jgi:HK97 family phage prohead protease
MAADARLPVREVPFRVTSTEPDPAGDGLTMEGYAAVYDTDTAIDSWEGVFTERLRRGVFRNSLRGGRKPMLQYDHGRHPLIGSIPIGAIRDLYEDDQGLFVRARLTDNWLVQPIRDAIRDGGVTGMSFRFEPLRDEWRDGDGKVIKDQAELSRLLTAPGARGPLQRTLIEVRLLELGPVAWPAYAETSVAVRSAATDAVMTALDDPVVRAEVARALLLDPPRDRHRAPDPDDDPDRDDDPGTTDDPPAVPAEAPPDPAPAEPDTPTAPPAESEPPAESVPDAPPAESEHPSVPSDDSPDPAPAARDLQMQAQLAAVREAMAVSIL